ncbi:MAG: M24 family metallopeptidase [Candidatus Zixiibacteriota bacterium]
MDIIKEKIIQVGTLLEEMDIDLWLIFVRETMMQADPALAMVVGHEVVWQSFFFYTRRGDAIALVGNFDEEDFKKSGHFTEVYSYTEGVRQDFNRLLKRLDPASIAVNYSLNNPAADGLTHGMYLQLQEYLKDTSYASRLRSAEDLCTRLRSRKTTTEQELISAAAFMAADAWKKSVEEINPGFTEKEIAAIVDRNIGKLGGTNSFNTIVNAGDKTRPGHGLPTDEILRPGDLLHVDFGARWCGYCSDIQRLLYIKRPGEKDVPDLLREAFETVREIIDRTGEKCRPGVTGYEIDALARQMLTDRGYPEYEHALGHQLGRDVHDGGAIIGPRWERYGVTPTIPLEVGNVFTLELEIILPGIGCAGLEEDICVTERGARFLCPRQTELLIK